MIHEMIQQDTKIVGFNFAMCENLSETGKKPFLVSSSPTSPFPGLDANRNFKTINSEASKKLLPPASQHSCLSQSTDLSLNDDDDFSGALREDDNNNNTHHLLNFVVQLTSSPPRHRWDKMQNFTENLQSFLGNESAAEDYTAALYNHNAWDAFAYNNNHVLDRFAPSTFPSPNNEATSLMNVASCRSTLSFASNNATTAASTPLGTPTWLQEATNREKSPETPPDIDDLFCSQALNLDNALMCARWKAQETAEPDIESDQRNFGLPSLSGLPLTATALQGDDNPDKNYSSQSSFSNNSQSTNLYPYEWNDEKNSTRRNNNNIQRVPEFLELPYVSKRWQNLNVVLPLYIPHGIIAVIRSTGENTYVFRDHHPSSQLLFSGAGKICDMWATYLRLRVAVIHKCPEFLVPRVAQVFNQVLSATLPKFAKPIHLRCAGIVKHTIQLRSSAGLTFRYDTIGQVSNSADQEKMRAVFDALQRVMNEVNLYLAKELEESVRSFQDGNNDLRNSVVSGVPRGGLEFRFSPCKELKIAIREGTLCDCAGVDSLIAGGGASSMSTWAQQFIVENLIVGEVRLERDKTSETQLDPFFLPVAEVKTRMITKDLEGNPARVCFVDSAFYAEYCRPKVEQAIGLTSFQAGEQLVGATLQQLSKLLPNGLQSFKPALRRPVGYGSGGFAAPSSSNNIMMPFGGFGSLNRPSAYPTAETSSDAQPFYASRPLASQRPEGDPSALRGLELLQRMLATLSLNKNSTAENSQVSPEQNDHQQGLESILQSAEAAALLTQFQSVIQQLPATSVIQPATSVIQPATAQRARPEGILAPETRSSGSLEHPQEQTLFDSRPAFDSERTEKTAGLFIRGIGVHEADANLGGSKSLGGTPYKISTYGETPSLSVNKFEKSRCSDSSSTLPTLPGTSVAGSMEDFLKEKL